MERKERGKEGERKLASELKPDLKAYKLVFSKNTQGSDVKPTHRLNPSDALPAFYATNFLVLK